MRLKLQQTLVLVLGLLPSCGGSATVLGARRGPPNRDCVVLPTERHYVRGEVLDGAVIGVAADSVVTLLGSSESAGYAVSFWRASAASLQRLATIDSSTACTAALPTEDRVGVVVLCPDRVLMADGASGSITWAQSGGGRRLSHWRSLILVGDRDVLVALRQSTGEVEWRREDCALEQVVGDELLCRSAGGRFFVDARDGQFRREANDVVLASTSYYARGGDHDVSRMITVVGTPPLAWPAPVFWPMVQSEDGGVFYETPDPSATSSRVQVREVQTGRVVRTICAPTNGLLGDIGGNPVLSDEHVFVLRDETWHEFAAAQWSVRAPEAPFPEITSSEVLTVPGALLVARRTLNAVEWWVLWTSHDD